jgi:hypothetical protein
LRAIPSELVQRKLVEATGHDELSIIAKGIFVKIDPMPNKSPKGVDIHIARINTNGDSASK